MGRKTLGPYLVQAIEANQHERVHDICARQLGANKEKVRELIVSPVRRLADEHTEVPLLLAAQLPDPNILAYFAHKFGVDVNHICKEQLGRRVKVKTALIMAVRRGLYDTVELLISCNADLNIQDHKGRSALHHAVRKADFRMAKMLLSRGATSSLVDKAENTPLHVASIFGHVELCKMLLHYGADLYKKGQLGAIPIHIAAKEGHVSLLRMFCLHDVNPNIKLPCYDGREKAALHVAAEEGHHECVTCLIELGSDPNLGDSEGETPLTCCVLREYDPLGMKSKDDYTETVKTLLRNGASVNLQNGRGESALHLAARNEFHKIVELLLQAGIDPLLEDNAGDKALDLVGEEDAVTSNIIKQAMQNRERYLNDVFEMKAKGFSTSLDVLTTGRSTSSLNRTDSIASSGIGRSHSTQGLIGLPPNQLTYEEAYLQPVRSNQSSLVSGAGRGGVQVQVHHDNSGSQTNSSGGSGQDSASQVSQSNRSLEPEQTYMKIDSTFDEHEPVQYKNTNPQPSEAGTDQDKTNKKFTFSKFMRRKNSQDNGVLQRQSSQRSTASSQFDNQSMLSASTIMSSPSQAASPQRHIPPIEQGTRKLPTPPSSAHDESQISDTPRSSISTFRPDSDFGVGRKTDELLKNLQKNMAAAKKMQVYSDISTTQYEDLPGASGAAAETKRAPTTPQSVRQMGASPGAQRQPRIVLHDTGKPPTQQQQQQQQNGGMSDSDDTFFDDESFDSASEVTVEMAQQKIQAANQQLYQQKAGSASGGGGAGGGGQSTDNNVQKWLSEQATLVAKRNYENAPGRPVGQNTPPSSKVKSASMSDTDDQFTSVSQQVSKPHPPCMAVMTDNNANSKPLPPPRPPKDDPPPKPPVAKKHVTKTSTTSVETDSNALKVEVDEKEPGQTVIRILPSSAATKKVPPSPKPPVKGPTVSTSASTSVSNTTPGTMSSFATLATEAQRVQTGRHAYRDGVLDTESEVGAPSEVSTTSSVPRPAPRKRGKTLSRIESRRESPRKNPSVIAKAAPANDEISSDLSDFETTGSDDENIDTSHMTARFFVAPSLNTQPAQLRASQDLLEIDSSPAHPPATPTIKMTWNAPENATAEVEEKKTPLPRIKVLPDLPSEAEAKRPKLPPPKPPPKPVDKLKAAPEAPPKIAPRPAPKPESVSSKEEAPVKKPPVVIPSSKPPAVTMTPEITPRSEPPRMKPVSKPTEVAKQPEETPAPKPAAKKTIHIEAAPKPQPLATLVAEEQFSTGSEANEDEALPQPVKTKKKKERKAAKADAAAAAVEDAAVVPAGGAAEEDGEQAEKPKKEKKKKKKKTKAAAQQDENKDPEAGDASLDQSMDPLPVVAPGNASMVDVDDTYLKPVSRGAVAEEPPASGDQPGLVTSRQKRKAKRQQSKTTVLQDTEEMQPAPDNEPAVYQNSPPARPKVKHTTANKDGVPYAVPDKAKSDKPLFVKVERNESDLSGSSGGPPPVPEFAPPQESPYADISVVDDIINTPERPQPHGTPQSFDSDTAKRVTIGNKEFIPNHTKRAKDHDHRRISFTFGEHIDFDIVGGNADGVFVHNLRAGSPAVQAGLKNGDKILSVNGRTTTNKTREEVVALFSGIKRMMDLTVRERTDVYRTVLDHGGIGDAFFVRAHYNYRAQQQGELAVHAGDLFSIKDTLPNNIAGYWRVVKLNAGPRDQTSGYILSEQRAEQFVQEQRMAQLKAFEKQKGGFMKKGFNRSKSLDRLKKDPEEMGLSGRAVAPYERVEQRKAPFPKPVLLLGLFCDHVRDLLARQQPDRFAIPTEALETFPGPNSPPGTGETLKVDVIKRICYSGKHCLTVLSPKAIQYLQKTDLNPIVIYLAPGSKAIIKVIKTRFAPHFDRKPSFLWDEAMAFERDQGHLFTGTVPYTDNDKWVENLKEMITLLQEQPQWYIVQREEDEEEDVEEPEQTGSSRPLPLRPNQFQPSSHGGRLNRSMEDIHVPEPRETPMNLSFAGRPPADQRMRAQSSGEMLTSDFDSLRGRSTVPKSILKNKGYSPNNSDSGSNSSFSQSASGRGQVPAGRPTPPSSLPPRPPQHALSSMLQSPSSPSNPQASYFPRPPGPQRFHQPCAQAGFSGPLQPAAPITHQSPPRGTGYAPPQQTGYQPAGYRPPVAAQQQAGFHPGAQQRAQTPDQQPQNMAGFHPAFQQLGPGSMQSVRN